MTIYPHEHHESHEINHDQSIKMDIPSGKHAKNNGKSPLFYGDSSTISMWVNRSQISFTNHRGIGRWLWRMPLRWSRGEEFHGLNGAFFFTSNHISGWASWWAQIGSVGGDGTHRKYLGNIGWIISGWWFGTCLIFPYVFIYIYIYMGRIIPTDELIFFREVGIPPTR